MSLLQNNCPLLVAPQKMGISIYPLPQSSLRLDLASYSTSTPCYVGWIRMCYPYLHILKTRQCEWCQNLELKPYQRCKPHSCFATAKARPPTQAWVKRKHVWCPKHPPQKERTDEVCISPAWNLSFVHKTACCDHHSPKYHFLLSFLLNFNKLNARIISKYNTPGMLVPCSCKVRT